jgi:hypothetical protein
MPAWDNVSLPGSPQPLSYGPPQIGMQLGALLGNLPQDYLQGLQQQAAIRNLNLQNSFLQNYLPGGQGSGGPSAPDPLGGGGPGAASAQAAASGSAADPRGLAPFIRSEAAKYGVDPNVALRVAMSEGLSNPVGDSGKSHGAFQLYTGGGLGNEFQKQTGLDPADPANEKATISWALQNAARTGWSPYKGAAKVGIGNRTGIGAPGQQTASTDPNFMPSGQPQAVQTAGGAAPTPEAAPPQQIAQNAPAPAPGAPAGVSAAAALVPPQFRADPRGYADRLRSYGNELMKGIGPELKIGPLSFDNKAKLQRAQLYLDKAKEIDDALKQEAEPTGAQKEARQAGYASPQAAALGEEAGKGEVKAGQEMYQAIKETALQHQRDLKPILDLGKSIVNNPQFYSGTGGERSLDFNRALATLGGDPRKAQLQEMFGKLRAQNVLQVIANQKTQMGEAGQNAGRMYAQTIETIEKAIPGLETTKNGNRALLEIESRIGDFKGKIFDEANRYLAEQRQRGVPHPYLDQAFDKRLADFVKNNQPFSEQEKAHPETLGAPTAPAGLRTPADIHNWGLSMGLKPGEALRAPDGRLVPLP